MCSVTQLCPTLCDPTDWSPPSSSDQDIFQARILEYIAISYSRRLSRPRDQTYVSVSPALAGRFFATSATWEAHDTQQNWKKTWSQGLPVPSSCDCWHDKMMTVIKKKKKKGERGWEVGGRFKREGTYVCLWLIHAVEWQKPSQYYKAIILQLKRTPLPPK